MKQRMSFKNQPKIQAKRYKRLKLEKEQELAKRTTARPIKARSRQRAG